MQLNEPFQLILFVHLLLAPYYQILMDSNQEYTLISFQVGLKPDGFFVLKENIARNGEFAVPYVLSIYHNIFSCEKWCCTQLEIVTMHCF